METVIGFGRDEETGNYFLRTDAGSEILVTPFHGLGIYGFDEAIRPSLLDSLHLDCNGNVLWMTMRHIQPEIFPERTVPLAAVTDSPALQNWILNVNALLF